MAVHTLSAKRPLPNGIIKDQKFQVTLPNHIGVNTPKGIQAAQRKIFMDTGVNVSTADIMNGFYKTRMR